MSSDIADKVLSEYARICVAEHDDDAPRGHRVEAMQRALESSDLLSHPQAASSTQAADIDDGGPYNGIDWQATLRSAAKRLRLGVEGPRIADELDCIADSLASSTTPASGDLSMSMFATRADYEAATRAPVVDEAMVERAARAYVDWYELGNSKRESMRAALEAALTAAQEGAQGERGGSDGR